MYFAKHGVIANIQIQTKRISQRIKFSICHPVNKDRHVDWIHELKSSTLFNASNETLIEDLKLNQLENARSVFTRKGERIELPENSSPLDFAFTISTKLGYNFSHAIIHNEKLGLYHQKVDMHYKLQAGDTIYIHSSNKITPDVSWLHCCETHNAKNAIKRYIKKSPGKRSYSFWRKNTSNRIKKIWTLYIPPAKHLQNIT